MVFHITSFRCLESNQDVVIVDLRREIEISSAAPERHNDGPEPLRHAV
jgi:hypothetical protein